MKTTLKHLVTVLIGSVVTVMSGLSVAQSEKQPLVVLVPWGQGGVLDRVARSLAPALERSLGKRVVVLNVAGSDAHDRHRTIQNAPNDGSTIAIVSMESTWLGTAANGFSVTRYQPLAQLAAVAPALLVPPNSPFKNVGDVLAFAQGNPGKLKASGSEYGGTWHLALAGLLRANGLPSQAVTWIPSEGAGPAIQDLLAGAVDLVVMPSALAASQLASGQLTELAILSANRDSSRLSVPTVAQSGSAPYAFEYWIGIVAPPGTATSTSEVLANVAVTAAKESGFSESLRGAGLPGLMVSNRASFATTLEKSDGDIRTLRSIVGNPK